MKLKIKLLKNRIVFILYCFLMLVIAFVLNRFFQMLMFLLFFNLIQDCFNWRFHAETIESNPIKAVKYCKIITIIIHILYLIYCKNLDTSLYSNLFIILLIALLNCLVQFTLERIITRKMKLCDKETLLRLCEESGLSRETTNRLVMKYIEHKTIKEIAAIESVEEQTIKMTINRAKKKLNFE